MIKNIGCGSLKGIRELTWDGLIAFLNWWRWCMISDCFQTVHYKMKMFWLT